MKTKAGILILSDKGARGERQDLCTDILRTHLEKNDYIVSDARILPDDYDGIVAALQEMAEHCALLLTSGGTGLSPRDNTPEATMAVATKSVPGIAEAMRAYSMQFTDRAMLSRACAVIRNRTLIINLPGSPKALEETLAFILPPVKHGVEILLEQDADCARTGDTKSQSHEGGTL